MVTSWPALALNPLPMTMAWVRPGPRATERTIRNGMKPSVNRAANCSELSMNPSSHSWVQTRPATVGSSQFRPALTAELAVRQPPGGRGLFGVPRPGEDRDRARAGTTPARVGCCCRLPAWSRADGLALFGGWPVAVGGEWHRLAGE